MRAKDFQEFMQHCRPIKKMSEDRTLIQIDQTSQYIVIKTVPIGPTDSSILLQALFEQKQLFHEHLLTVIDYCQTSKQEIQVLIQFSTHTLEEQFQARKKLKNKFSLQELENILLSIVKAMKYLQDKCIGHGCISLKDISISENGIIKLIDPSMASNSPFKLQKGYFYSPQLLSFNTNNNTKQCKNSYSSKNSHPEIHYFEAEESFSDYFSSNASENNTSIPKNTFMQKNSSFIPQGEECQIDFFKNDIFCLGMTLLELGLLVKRDKISQKSINSQLGIIKFQVLEEFLNDFQDFYGASFTNLLSRMLQEDPSNRVTVDEILQIIEDEFYNDFSQNQSEIQRNPSSMGINSYYYDYDGQSDLAYSGINNKTVKSFVLMSQVTNNNCSKEESLEDVPLKVGDKKCFQSISNVESSMVSNPSSHESLLLQNPISLIPKKNSIKQRRKMQKGSQNIESNFSVEQQDIIPYSKRKNPLICPQKNNSFHKNPLVGRKTPLLKF